MSLEPGSEIHAEDPSSERWLEYYRDARRRRRARGPQQHTRVQLRKIRNRQIAFLVSGLVSVGVLTTIFYFVLER